MVYNDTVLNSKGSSIIFSIFTSVQRVLFLHTLPPPQKHTIKMLIGLTCFMYICTGTVAKTNIFESIQLDLSPPALVYSLYSCENAENNG